MKYLGSKSRIAKYIAPIIQKCIDENNITEYYEPFVGGANLIDKIKCKSRYGSDIHKQLIAMWQALQKGWMPPKHISEEEYNYVKANRDKLDDSYVGYVGFHATFSAKYFDGYARGFKNDGVTPRCLSSEAFRNTMKQLPFLMDVHFSCKSYEEVEPHNAVVYCDIPYENTTKYKTNSFDYDAFWDWCRRISVDNFVFISSYTAPDDFTEVWSKDVLANFSSQRNENTNKKRTEKLFTYRKEDAV